MREDSPTDQEKCFGGSSILAEDRIRRSAIPDPAITMIAAWENQTATIPLRAKRIKDDRLKLLERQLKAAARVRPEKKRSAEYCLNSAA